ncbi:FUSC family protein [Telmatobacter bradus]|uniref:FUSC family protein n=1 Tax=Telmatobacter bradus TaxID=474953 RepID=UPI003B4348A0
MIHAAKIALAASISWWIATCIGLPDGYWGSISSVIVLQSNFGATVTASRDRFLGTIIGAIVGFSCSLFLTTPWNFMLALLIAITFCGLIGFRGSMRLAGVTICVVMLVHASGPRWQLACFRVSEVMLGIATALVISTVILPDRARLHLRDGLAQEYLVLGSYFEAILEGFGGTPRKDLSTLRNEVSALLRDNNQLLQATRNEPSGGPGWREGLGMILQFGLGLFEALRALDFAVQDSHSDDYAQQLEPELGHLALDIRSGFHHVARCIHKWRFDISPQGMNLEKDIADLEARMDSVRHKGIGFSQAEILRAYAVQLHLKQIARQLRASRVETWRAIGNHVPHESHPTPASEQTASEIDQNTSNCE